jgi:predicted nucleotidyltransferase/predicted transcriptional regulator
VWEHGRLVALQGPDWKMPNLGTKMPKMGIKPARSKQASGARKAHPAKKRNSRHRASMVDALFTSTQKRLLALLFGQTDRTFFTTELIQLTESGSGAVQRELHRLTDAGLVVMTKQGNQKHFQASRAAPLFEELRGIVLKTVGLAEPINAALLDLKEAVQLAIVYGSVAKHADTASSDVDLLIVSDGLLLEKAYAALAPAEQVISRKINVILLTPEEFERRRTDNSPFLSKVLAGEHLVLIGDTDGIAATRKSGTHPTA